MWKKSFNLYLLLGLFLISSSCTMEIQKLRDAEDNLNDSSASYFYLSEINTTAAGGIESLVFNQLEDQADYPSEAIQCSSKVTPAPVPLSTYLELTDDNGTLSGKIVFTKNGPKMSMTPCYLSVNFSGETLSITFAGKQITFNYENDEANGVFTISAIAEDPDRLSRTKDILKFSILGQQSASIDQDKHIIYVTMPFGSSLEGLIASFNTDSLAEDPVAISGVVQISGVTANSFIEWEPLVYTVTAEDGTTQEYSVIVLLANGSDDMDFLEFSIIGQISSEITVDGEGIPIISVLMPEDSSLNGLVAEFSTNSLADPAVHIDGVWQFSGVTENDFTEGSAKAYWVVSQSKLSKMYNVIVIREEAPIITYKVTYDNDPSGGWKEYYEAGSLIDIASPTPKPDWAFIGWEDLATSIVYQPGDTMTVNEDVTFYALWEELVPEPEFVIGDTGPGGGLIFYIDEENAYDWDYLEAAPVVTENPMGQWSTVTSVSIGSTSPSIGTGLENTLLIIDQHGAEGTSMAKYCFNLEHGKTDWFLPSREEVLLMYNNLKVAGLGGFSGGTPAMYNYWSSTEATNEQAFAVDFYDGRVVQMMKSAGAVSYTRCIRSGNF